MATPLNYFLQIKIANLPSMKTLIISILTLVGFASYAQQEKFTVNFDFDKYEITQVSKSKLDSFLRISPSTIQKINLYGHCDFIGNNIYNDELSLKRVDAVKKYLIQNIPDNVFDTEKGFGKRQPLNQNSNDEERFLNRRVEIIIERKPEEKVVVQVEKKDTMRNLEQSLTEKIKDTTTKTGTNIVLKNMNFVGGRHILLPQSIPVLSELLTALKDNPTIEIEIQGHICCTAGREDGLDFGTNTYNLSVNRALAVYEYLVENGIDKKRLSYRGFGHSRPLEYPEDTEEKRTTNRRVEIKIVKK